MSQRAPQREPAALQVHREAPDEITLWYSTCTVLEYSTLLGARTGALLELSARVLISTLSLYVRGPINSSNQNSSSDEFLLCGLSASRGHLSVPSTADALPMRKSGATLRSFACPLIALVAAAFQS